MRVTRRVRPSQVGCGATIGRRRLYAAIASVAGARNDVPPVPRIALIIESDGQIVPADGPKVDSSPYQPATELAGSNPRGQ